MVLFVKLRAMGDVFVCHEVVEGVGRVGVGRG